MRKLFLIIIILLIASVISVSAQASTSPLLQMLARIPDSDAAHQFLSYVDYPALIAARPGAPTVSTWQQFEQYLNDKSPTGLIYRSALVGINSGPSYLNSLASEASHIPDVLGFDFLGVDQAVEYGQPPDQVTILTGNLTASAVIAAHEQRGYTSSSLNHLTLLCPANGCDSGTQLDPANINRANLFGGDLGRNEPVLVTDHLIVNSASIDALNAVANLSAGSSLADNPDYRAAAEAITANATLLQTYFITPFEAAGSAGAPITMSESSQATEQAAGASLPAYNLVAFADTATRDEEQTLIALVYGSQTTAQAAAALFPDRLQNAVSARANDTFGHLLESRGAASIDVAVFPASTSRSVVVVTLHTPLPPATIPADGQPQSMSLVYRLLIQAYTSRDLGWLATS